MSDNSSHKRLPPPVFPPGSRKQAQLDSNAESPETMLGDEAFISPGDPIPKRRTEMVENFLDDSPDQAEEGEVVGTDLDPHTEGGEPVFGGDPHVVELIEAVGKLSEALRSRGEMGLSPKPDMSQFEATLRSYCVGYLAGRRVEQPLPAVIEEALPTDL